MSHLPSNYVWSSQQNWQPETIQLTNGDRVLHEIIKKGIDVSDIDEMLLISIRYGDLLVDRMVQSV
jgi:hypothetical protein